MSQNLNGLCTKYTKLMSQSVVYVGTFLSLKFVILRTRSTLTMRLLETAALKSSLVYLQIKFSKQ
ncbi:Uncharacterised protein [Vibrio cholerae]|nr:Uncharacterised protein [Vibrio cholerae]